MPSLSFKSSVSVTHITTATTILSIDDVNFLIDPTFDKKGDFEQQGGFVLTKTDDPALGLEDLPVIHAVLLSHEDHIDNLDTSDRTMLNGRHQFKITGTPTQHLPGGECTGFVLESPSLGVNEADGLPNLTRDIDAEKMVPLHFESWKHFTESGDDVRAELAADAAVKDKVVWVVPGEKTTVV
ncbi:hypothetical protein JG688_00008366 [Phytophthora aleatoria]|uniref:Metallo-beta-lactamase domain-containing protein n=1 Tax=Phytophthora aleatoria TaxID=2496075 RepID=A0A8J5M3M4_9STRA|nr:hypothetical protein JG688_00008366 [Phytophthora aleatoria]